MLTRHERPFEQPHIFISSTPIYHITCCLGGRGSISITLCPPPITNALSLFERHEIHVNASKAPSKKMKHTSQKQPSLMNSQKMEKTYGSLSRCDTAKMETCERLVPNASQNAPNSTNPSQSSEEVKPNKKKRVPKKEALWKDKIGWRTNNLCLLGPRTWMFRGWWSRGYNGRCESETRKVRDHPNEQKDKCIEMNLA